MRVTTVDDRWRPSLFYLFSTILNFWAARGRPGEHLGGSWCVRGASWESLGRSWGDLGATFEAVRFRIDVLIDFERQKGAKRNAFGWAKGSQNPSQDDPQTA